jgi:hypothetical protein
MSYTMRELLELRLAGKPLPPIDEQNARRVYCRECLDDGIIRVWHPKTVEEVKTLLTMNRPLAEIQTHYDAIAACSCSRGDEYHKRQTKDGTRIGLARFSEQFHCRLRTSTKDADDHTALEEWIANWRPPNHSADLERWNNDAYSETEFQFEG